MQEYHHLYLKCDVLLLRDVFENFRNNSLNNDGLCPSRYLSAPVFCFFVVVFFLSVLSFTDTDNSQDSRGREGTFLYSTLPLPPAHEHSDIYVQLCT